MKEGSLHNKNFLSETWKSISVFFDEEVMGGRRLFADDFLGLLYAVQPPHPARHLLEWCSGPGFIGYALMANGFCTDLTLAENREAALEAAAYTAMKNKIEDNVTLYKSLDLSGLPSDRQFDLVVGNPPYFPNRVMLEEVHKADPKANPCIYVDPDWQLHKKFFSDIRRFLAPNGRIILLESTNASHLETFRPMIEGNGLKISGWRWATLCGDKMWYLFVTRDDATEPFF